MTVPVTIRLYGTASDSIVDGPGLRYAVFVQGCSHACPGCHNPESQPTEGGTECSIDELVAAIRANGLVRNVTLSGGEPFEQAPAAAELARRLKALGYGIWTYTGYLYEDLCALAGSVSRETLPATQAPPQMAPRTALPVVPRTVPQMAPRTVLQAMPKENPRKNISCETLFAGRKNLVGNVSRETFESRGEALEGNVSRETLAFGRRGANKLEECASLGLAAGGAAVQVPASASSALGKTASSSNGATAKTASSGDRATAKTASSDSRATAKTASSDSRATAKTASSGNLATAKTSGHVSLDPMAVRALLDATDVLVDGPYLESRRSLGLKWRGSSNQRLIDVPASRAAGRVILWEAHQEFPHKPASW